MKMRSMREKLEPKIPIVSRIVGDTIVELTFDPEKAKTALVVSRFNGLWNLESEFRTPKGETLIPYAETNNLIASKCVLLASKPDEYGLKSELISDIKTFIHRYVDLTSDFESIAAYYVLLTWVYDAFTEVPYLRFIGDWGTGKSRALTVVGSICYKPFFASGASTVSPIFHIQDAFGGTLVLDEADMPYSDAKAELVKILNNGTSRGMPVLRSIVNRHREINPHAFKVFGPKLLASRERFEDEALESRFITERTGAGSMRPDIPIAQPKSLTAEAQLLRNRLLHFRLCEYFKVNPDAAVDVKDWDPRLRQMALPLLAMVEDPLDREVVMAGLVARFEQTRAERSTRPEFAVLASALALAGERPDQDLAIGDVTRRYNETYAGNDMRSSRWIGSVLRNRFGLSTRKTRGVYVLSATDKAQLTSLAAKHGVTP